MQEESKQAAFLDYLDEYNRFLEQVAEAQSQKIEALLSHDPKVIEHSVARQQAVSMQMDAYEERRSHLQQEAGLGGLTFSQLEQQIGPRAGKRVAACRARMQELVSQIRFFNDKAMHLVETNLQVLNLEMPPEERVEGQSYDGRGKQSAPLGAETSLFEAKI